MGLGSLIWTIPHFSTSEYSKHDTSSEGNPSLCGSETVDPCVEKSGGEVDGSNLSAYRFVFIFGQILHGFGAAPLITLGTTFLDGSVSARSSPLYIAVFQTWFLIGPAIGYVWGGQLLSIHTDLLEDSGLTPESSLWVGAWWPGFLITFSLSVVCGFIIFCYPRSINRKKMKSNSEKTESGLAEALPKYLLSLVTNPN